MLSRLLSDYVDLPITKLSMYRKLYPCFDIDKKRSICICTFDASLDITTGRSTLCGNPEWSIGRATRH